MNDFSLPTNIKQIGTIGDGLRIYMEDYVCTYLFQFAEAGGYAERAALLVGKYMVIDGQPVLFINGAVQGKYTEEKNGLICFTDKTDTYVNAMIAEFFDGMEVVGWMQSQPSYGIYLNQHYAAYHQRIFTRDHQVLFVMDPLERINAFYAWNADRSGLAEVKGYFIYYDKNRCMHEYMLRNKTEDFKTQPPSFVEITRMERAEDAEEAEAVRDTRGGYDLRGEPARDSDYTSHGSPEDVIRRHQADRTRRRSSQEQRRTVNLLVSLSAVLFVVCFVIGAGLIQNQDRVARMEEQLSQLSTAYRNLFVQISGDKTASVFASQSEDDPTAGAQPAQPDPARVIEEDGSLMTTAPAVVAPPASAQTTQPADTTTAPPAEPVTEATAPPENTQTSASSVPETYTIQPGDSLIAISVRFYGDNTRVDDILTVNGIDNADRIMAGKTIVLPRP